MNPVDRVTRFLAVAGIDRPAEKTFKTASGTITRLDPLTPAERAAAYTAAAERAFALVQSAEEARDLTISHAKLAITRAIAIGEFLVEMAEVFSGDFDEWLEGHCAERISRATAYRYIKAVRYRAALGDECPEFATLKDLFIAAGILPAPSSGESSEQKPSPPIFRLRFEMNASGDPVEWEPVVRREFIAKARPIAELLQKAIAAEERE